jgi:hypothetical protein
MNAALLEKIFGRDQRWHGPCTVILDAEAGVTALGVDSIVGGGAKFYAPRMVSGRVSADSVCLLEDLSAVLLVQNQKVRQNTGEESLRQTLTIADVAHVVAVEMPETSALGALGVSNPPRQLSSSQSGYFARPTG